MCVRRMRKECFQNPPVRRECKSCGGKNAPDLLFLQDRGVTVMPKERKGEEKGGGEGRGNGSDRYQRDSCSLGEQSASFMAA